MPEKKLCCRIFPIILILISAVINAGLWYFDEGNHGFKFLTDKDEFYNYLGFTLAVALLPIAIFYYFSGKEKFFEKARPLSLLGFVPVIIFLLVLALW
ncbi:hypothetical protein [uncultured Draconibacterium sp.]|uniref:hypothetical protein n=1 Tax=uncultured Draconibacterium sp. TaxID=1573823 RepID=UPI0025EEE85E|nr:hypothetical protein [uncultured Draconibacterium sp.]